MKMNVMLTPLASNVSEERATAGERAGSGRDERTNRIRILRREK
jgi:hypothetical protein